MHRLQYINKKSRAFYFREKHYKVRKEAKIRKRYNQVPKMTQDTTLESNKNTINITNKSQEVSPFPAGDQRSTVLERTVKYSLESLNRFTRHICDVKPFRDWSLMYPHQKNDWIISGFREFSSQNFALGTLSIYSEFTAIFDVTVHFFYMYID